MTAFIKCPVCGCRQFQLGPQGGLAQNVRCENGHEFNLMGPFGSTSIGRSEPLPGGCTCH